ncbi:Os04g0422750 [Oryza sativa Japonica Group]|uniref:Os04g0422750 protein n=1 Tax=Oryza sativa subsp. japonica TaxID=39947 RepID=A0A0P0WAL2_ORYSJ|nr:Os04g0422750 [Oryza sativa Japonica Group]
MQQESSEKKVFGELQETKRNEMNQMFAGLLWSLSEEEMALASKEVMNSCLIGWLVGYLLLFLAGGGHGQDGGGVGDAGGERHRRAAADEGRARACRRGAGDGAPALASAPALPPGSAPRGLRRSDGSVGMSPPPPSSEPGNGGIAGAGAGAPNGAGRGE